VPGPPPWPEMPPAPWLPAQPVDRAAVERALRIFAPPPAVPLANARWTSIEYWGLHGLWGGEAIRIHSDGTVLVERGLSRAPIRYQANMSAAGITELDWLLSDIVLAAIPPSRRVPVPDQMWFELALVTPSGVTIAGRWDNEPHEEFDELREWMTLAAKAVFATHAPTGRGRNDWRPPSRTIGSPDPRAVAHPGVETTGRSTRTHYVEPPRPPTLSSHPPSIRRVRHLIPAATPIRCASLITDGLERVGFDELMITVPEEFGPDRDEAPLFLLKSIIAALETSPRLGPGAYIGAKTASLPGWSRVSGFALERPWPMDKVEMPARCLSLHALIGEELEAVRNFGPQRLLARLGLANRFFPTPPWCDPTRAPIAKADEPTILARTSSIHLPGVTVTRERPWFVLRIARSTHATLAQDLPTVDPADPFALLASLHESADASLAWTPGQAQAEANALRDSPGARLAGSFLLLDPGRPADGGGILEDGFAMSLTTRSARLIRNALRNGIDVDLPPAREDAVGLRLEWTL
jgi:hypothetical protein